MEWCLFLEKLGLRTLEAKTGMAAQIAWEPRIYDGLGEASVWRSTE